MWLTKGCLSSANNKLYKQIDGCPMGSPISVAMAGIFMNKLERDVIKPPLPIFYKWYVDDIYVMRKRNIDDKLFNDLNNYYENIKFTVENAPKMFLDTQILCENNTISTKVVSNEVKLPVHWSSKIPKRYKRNIINGELHRMSEIACDFEEGLARIREKYNKAGYPIIFVNSFISSFTNDNPASQPRDIYEMRVLINLPFCPENEKYTKLFLSKLNIFSENKFSFLILWKTRKLLSLFQLKDKVDSKHCFNVVYEGTCSCGTNYIGITDRNASLRFDEHNNPKKNSEPAKHIKRNEGHAFTWKIVCKTPKLKFKGRILEAFLIKFKNPSLNNQVDSFQLKLFQNGMT